MGTNKILSTYRRKMELMLEGREEKEDFLVT
jgi:hypothetical protein